ncbi:hypothetical protein PV721_26815 [Streptomyces sp. MB09-01]|uniref:hypothetical protein n=1 Tax=Streptomyces sp. MB09-01 TaxID=3028666 RepID=UPI0029BEE5AA|nr:hypothetical protein [Streptomyces sp. MB09-01]MDX3537899.1 hypothetical protein [Streptomyces sp. MB09-01]
MESNEDLDHARGVLLVRDAMDRTTADLPALPDLSGPARAQGLRRRARVRAAIGGGVLTVVAIAVAGTIALPDGGGGGATRVGVAASPSAGQSRTQPQPQPPVHLEPSPGESSMADLPAAERAKQEQFQNRAVSVLQDLLPDGVGTLQRTDLSVRLYQGTKDGKTFIVVFSVRPTGADTDPRTCVNGRGFVCKKGTLPDGTEVIASTSPSDGGDVTESRIFFRYNKSNVSLSVSPHDASHTSAPVTNDQLLALAKDPAFLDLVKTADADPVEQAQKILPAGE